MLLQHKKNHLKLCFLSEKNVQKWYWKTRSVEKTLEGQKPKGQIRAINVTSFIEQLSRCFFITSITSVCATE